MPSVLIFGATGNIGSATLRAALERGHTAYAFVRTPSKIPASLAEHPNCVVIQGDASSTDDVTAALRQNPPVDAVVIAAPIAGILTADGVYEQINKNIVRAVQAEQTRRANESRRTTGDKELAGIRVWVMMGQSVMEHPQKRGVYLRNLLPFTAFPEYEPLIAFLEAEATDVFWTINAPGILSAGPPRGTLVEGITVPPRWRDPLLVTRYFPFGLGFNAIYNWARQRITFDGVAEYMVDNLDLDERLRGKRVAVIEDPEGIAFVRG